MDIVEVFEGTLFQSQMVVNLLENEGIEAFLRDEILGTRSPTWRSAGGVKVIVSSRDFDKAKLVVDDYERTMKGQP
jgi:hypothetical protein